ncbi:MAG: triose-phosphate isomerase [Alphaproteobacteria bacterium]|nr:triose-phosphate isomerase [Alphaproteobacteria bacterium]
MSRRLFIAGNWKMHKGPRDADALAVELKRALVDHPSVDLAVAPPAISIPAVVARLQHTGIAVAGQDLHDQVSGAFTGAISGEMLAQAGATHVLVGHSERRALFGDTDQIVAAKLQAAFRAGLLPILCVGETLSERDAGQAEAVVARQLSTALSSLSIDQVLTLTIAYEPVWAIGTGRTASPAQAQEMHASIRGWLASRYPREVPATVRIQYGGSVKGSNAAGLLSQPDIDGALVGGAALTADSFQAIVAAAAQVGASSGH